MKRALTIVLIIMLAGVFLYACGIIPNSSTSIVTITIGDKPNEAVLKAEAATPWERVKHYLAEVDLTPEAQAYIPSVVQAIIVTVTSSDMSTPIVGVANIAPDQTSASIRIEVPNGNNRHFLVEGYRGVDSKVYFSGIATADLTGASVTLPVNMTFAGTGIYVNPSLPLSANTATCGIQASPCATITHVLTSRPATTDNDVIVALAGNYIPGTVAAIETFPFLLKPGMVLLCLGTGFSTVIDASTQTGVTVIRGNDNASIDNCMIRVGSGGTGVNDVVNPQIPTVTAATRINGSLFELPSGATTPTVGIALANDESKLIESSLTGTGAVVSAFGVQVNGGKPSIISSTISNLPIGVDITSAAGDALISTSDINNNTTGINIATPSKPVISSSRITGNSTGITLSNGIADVIGNDVSSNLTGIAISGGIPNISSNTITANSTGLFISSPSNQTINGNDIYCNFFLGVEIISSTAQVNLQDNAWTHDANTSPPGPILNTGNCFSGDDICYSFSQPAYLPVRPSPVPNGCPIP
jgi:hypothetical protein